VGTGAGSFLKPVNSVNEPSEDVKALLLAGKSVLVINISPIYQQTRAFYIAGT
jgi:hypothetical protein